MRDGDVVRLAGCHGQRNPDDGRAHRIRETERSRLWKGFHIDGDMGRLARSGDRGPKIVRRGPGVISLRDTGAYRGRQRRRRDALRWHDLARQLVELQLDVEVAQPLAIRLACSQCLEVERDVDVVADRDQLLGESRFARLRKKRLTGSLLGDLGRVRENLLDRAVAVHQLDGGLVPDAAYTGNVVG